MATKTMLLGAMLLSAGAAVVTPRAQAAPQYDDRYGGRDSMVRCESNNGRTQRCQILGDVRLVRQLSDSPCIEGRTWGRERGAVWVTQGCRGDFVGTGYGDGGYPGYPGPGGGNGQTFRCESKDGRYRQCDSGGRGRIDLVRQLSDAACIEGRTWGRERGGVWVDRGCRAEFQSRRGGGGWNDGGGWEGGYGQTIRCESSDNRTQRCGANVRRDVQLTRQLSKSACIEGRSWGWDRSGVWVSSGCRAEFSVR